MEPKQELNSGSRWHRWSIKPIRFADVLIGGVLLGFTLPLLIIVALAIKWDSPGPVFEAKRA